MNILQKELQSLRNLCHKKGANDDEVLLCKPKRSRKSLVGRRFKLLTSENPPQVLVSPRTFLPCTNT